MFDDLSLMIKRRNFSKRHMFNTFSLLFCCNSSSEFPSLPRNIMLVVKNRFFCVWLTFCVSLVEAVCIGNSLVLFLTVGIFFTLFILSSSLTVKIFKKISYAGPSWVNWRRLLWKREKQGRNKSVFPSNSKPQLVCREGDRHLRDTSCKVFEFWNIA